MDFLYPEAEIMRLPGITVDMENYKMRFWDYLVYK